MVKDNEVVAQRRYIFVKTGIEYGFIRVHWFMFSFGNLEFKFILYFAEDSVWVDYLEVIFKLIVEVLDLS